ncbi:MAG: hypothetical protein JXA07_03660 [Spirochaetes bacterium]|nr:hypothetical protein [Spirochaetota bacterium]
MRISSGLAEITFNRISDERIFVWPRYAGGRVNDVGRVARRDDPFPLYYKPPMEESEELIARYRNDSNTEYSPSGRIVKASPGIRPGLLFEAIA